MLHLCGNVTMWIIGGVGKSARSNAIGSRSSTSGGEIPSAELRRRLRSVSSKALMKCWEVDATELLSRRQIQGYDVNVLEAIYHVVEHFSMHTGQIILLSKARVGQDLKLWTAPKP